MRECIYFVEIWDDKQSMWYCLDDPFSDVLEAMERLEHAVSFGRVARIVGWLVSDVE